MRRTLRLTLVAATLAFTSPVNAEVMGIEGIFCTSTAGTREFWKWRGKNLTNEAAIIVVNDREETCRPATVFWNNDNYRTFGTLKFNDQDYVVIQMVRAEGIILLGDLRPIPDWFKKFQFVAFPASQAKKFFTKEPLAAEPSTCDDDCI